ncbi:Protocadherin Fat 4 [Stylophora pistillata]|uniref:Protocadherin Fat 4 n=1 Tax=Stylophora pistillata TaxID=50429 RepID=A0A2B4R3Q1_STYPI|nr:Protocadherin Fat 4 [Stylophora pistillata]
MAEIVLKQKMVSSVTAKRSFRDYGAKKRTRANPTPATMEERVQNREITTRALVEEDTQATSVKLLTAVCPILVNMVGPVRRRKEALFVPVLPATEGHFATKENHVIQTHATTEEDVCQHLKGSSVDVRQDTEEKHAQVGCNEEDECQPNPCQNGGRCVAHYFGGGFDCECPLGFRGTTCQGRLIFNLPVLDRNSA